VIGVLLKSFPAIGGKEGQVPEEMCQTLLTIDQSEARKNSLSTRHQHYQAN
jgi:hypothetical protein